jgi:hypothetical protein
VVATQQSEEQQMNVQPTSSVAHTSFNSQSVELKEDGQTAASNRRLETASVHDLDR